MQKWTDYFSYSKARQLMVAQTSPGDLGFADFDGQQLRAKTQIPWRIWWLLAQSAGHGFGQSWKRPLVFLAVGREDATPQRCSPLWMYLRDMEVDFFWWPSGCSQNFVLPLESGLPSGESFIFSSVCGRAVRGQWQLRMLHNEVSLEQWTHGSLWCGGSHKTALSNFWMPRGQICTTTSLWHKQHQKIASPQWNPSLFLYS